MSSTARRHVGTVAACIVAVLPGLFVAVGLRAWAAANWVPPCGTTSARTAPACLEPTSEVDVVAAGAGLVASGQGFTDPADPRQGIARAVAPPGWILVLAAGDAAGFTGSGGTRLVAALLGAGSAAVVGAVALVLDPRRARATGAVAALVWAVHPFGVEAAALLRPDVVLGGVLALLLLRLARLRADRWIADAMTVGLLLGAATTLRADMVTLVPVVALGSFLGTRRLDTVAIAVRRTALLASVAFAVPGLIVAVNSARGVGAVIGERGLFDGAPSEVGLVGSFASFETTGFLLDAGLLLGAAFVLRRRPAPQRWPFLTVAAGGVFPLAVAIASGGSWVGAGLPAAVASVVLVAPALVSSVAASGRVERMTSSAVATWRGWGPRRRWILPAAAFVLAFGVRLAIVQVVRPECQGRFDPLAADTCYASGGDAAYYLAVSSSIKGGYGYSIFGLPTALHPPLFPLLLTGFRMLGLDSPAGLRLGLCAVGAAGVVVIQRLARRTAELAGIPRGPTSVAAAVIAAVYPAFWVNDAMILSESLLVLTAGLALLAAVELLARPGFGRAAAFGAAVGAAALTRSELVLVGVVVAGTLVVRSVRTRRIGRGAAEVAVAGLVALLCVLPWLALNQGRFAQPVLMTTSPGGTLAQVACDRVFYSDFVGYYDLACLPAGFVSTDETVYDQRAMDQATAYLADHLDRVPVQVLAAFGRTFEVYAPGQNVRLAAFVEGRGLATSGIGWAAFVLLMPFAVLGAVLGRRRGVSVAPFAGALVCTLTSALFIGAIVRMRVPLEIAVVVLAAVVIGRLYELSGTVDV